MLYRVDFTKVLDLYRKEAENKASTTQRIPYSEFRTLAAITKFDDVELDYYTNFHDERTAAIKYDDGFSLYLDGAYEPFKKFLLRHEKDFAKQEEKESNRMNIPAMNLDFGPVVNDNIRLSPYGLTVKNKDQWLTYNATNGQTVDVTGFTFDFGKFIYKVPAAVGDVQPGDMVLHQGRPVYVTKVEGNSLAVVDILASENKSVIPVTNMFGFNFVTKVISLMNLNGTMPSTEQPFGNIMPMLVWSSILGDDKDGKNDFFGEMDFGKLMMFSMLSGQSNPLGGIMNLGGMFGSTGTSAATQV